MERDASQASKGCKTEEGEIPHVESPQLTPEDLVSTQAELKTLTDKYTKLSDRQSLKSNFIKFATNAVDEYNKKVASPSKPKQPEPSYSVQLTKEDEE